MLHSARGSAAHHLSDAATFSGLAAFVGMQAHLGVHTRESERRTLPGLRVRSRLIKKYYETGERISRHDMEQLALVEDLLIGNRRAGIELP
jgi:hypothetical protein